MNKKFLLLIFIALFLFGGIFIFKYGDFGTKFLSDLSNNSKWLVLIITIGALVDSINPCAISVLILTIAFLISVGRMRSDILKLGGIYIFGIFLTYILIGLGILQALYLFNTPNFMAKVGAAILIIFGLISALQALFPKFPIRLKIPAAGHPIMARLIEKGSMPMVFALGVVVALFEFPCTGGPYLLVLGLLHDQAARLKGLIYLLYYNLLFVLPLIIILLLAGNKAVVDKIDALRKKENKGLRLITGLLMVGLGIVILLI